MLILLYLSLSFLATAQVQKTWIGDTVRVYRFVHDSDTSYNVKFDFRTGTWLIYYEPTFEHLAKKVWYYNRDHSDTSWFRNGQLKGYWIGKDSITRGCYDFLVCYPNGSVKSETHCNGDSSVHTSYYPSGALKETFRSYRDSGTGWMVNHYDAEYYSNSQLKHDPCDVIGPRKNQRYYYENGQTSREVNWLGDQTIGDCKEWYSNGKIKAQGQYHLPLYLKNIYPVTKTGKWSYYS